MTGRKDAFLIKYINEYSQLIYSHYKNDMGRVDMHSVSQTRS